MRYTYAFMIFMSLLAMSCNQSKTPQIEKPTKPVFENKGHEVVYDMVQNVGNYDKLAQKKDVVYTYTYETPDGKTDITTEKYIFDGEYSYGLYTKHERTFADLEGKIEQAYDGEGYWLKVDGELLDDPKRLQRVAFNRPTNFYWFTMFQKLLDDGLIYEYIGEKSIQGEDYDIVKVSFESKNDKPTDIYQLYINKKTSLVDQFLFTVADFGVIETPFLMQLEYEKVDGLLHPTKRLYKKSTWDADVSEEPWIKVNWTDIKFDSGLSIDEFKK